MAMDWLWTISIQPTLSAPTADAVMPPSAPALNVPPVTSRSLIKPVAPIVVDGADVIVSQ